MTLDRFGEPIDPDRHPDDCDGFIGGRDADPPLRRCPICKPWLDPAIREAKLHGPYAEPQPRKVNP